MNSLLADWQSTVIKWKYFKIVTRWIQKWQRVDNLKILCFRIGRSEWTHVWIESLLKRRFKSLTVPVIWKIHLLFQDYFFGYNIGIKWTKKRKIDVQKISNGMVVVGLNEILNEQFHIPWETFISIQWILCFVDV